MIRRYGWLLLLGLLVACGANPTAEKSAPVPATPSDPLRLLWVSSYGDGDMQSFQTEFGIMESLAAQGYKVVDGTLSWEAVYLDLKPYASIAEILAQAVVANAAIANSQPDVVIVSDDEAIRGVISPSSDPNQLYVYCGLNGNPRDYNLTRPNIVGVSESASPIQTLEIALAFIPEADRYMILSDNSLPSKSLTLQVYEDLAQSHPDLQSSFWITENWLVWQDVVLNAGDVDFILLVSSNYVWNNQGGYVEQEALMAWMLENSPVPVFSMSDLAVINGAVAGLVSGGYDQGWAAGQIVGRIAHGVHPSSIQSDIFVRNRLVMNLAAARYWDLSIPIAFPLAAHVYRTLPGGQGGN
ncbi:MAG: hypothetical protein JXA21_16410 [Anaerolineae bacterium]|nr:hypothetical protein [Anaerolineae bacterium]